MINEFMKKLDKIKSKIKELYIYREMLFTLVIKEIKVKYKGSILGFFWSLGNPLLMLIVYSIVFSFIMRIKIKNYAIFLFVALLTWNYFTSSILQASGSLIYNSSLIKKIYFPREILPLTAVFVNLINYLLSLLILIPALIIFKIKITFSILAFPLILLTQTLLLIGISLLVSIGNVYFRDLAHIIEIFITIWFFLTPVIYPLEMIPEKFKSLFMLNPAVHIIEGYRNIFFYGTWPKWQNLGYLFLISCIFVIFSFYFFEKFQKGIAEEI